MELTYGRSAEHFMLELFELELDDGGHIMYSNGEYVPTLCGKASQRIDRAGGYVHDESKTDDLALVW